jgi:hypothetical protein
MTAKQIDKWQAFFELTGELNPGAMRNQLANIGSAICIAGGMKMTAEALGGDPAEEKTVNRSPDEAVRLLKMKAGAW